MPPKNKFSKEEIVEVAFQIAKEEGFEGISIRKVANKVGCSIAPIYVNFKDIDELKQAVVEKVQILMKNLIQEENTGEPFLDIGKASIKFAKQYSVIYREYILQGNKYIDQNKYGFNEILINQMKTDEELKDFTDQELKNILLKMKIFQVGISLLATDESFNDEFTENRLVELLKEVGVDVILGTRYRKNNLTDGDR